MRHHFHRFIGLSVYRCLAAGIRQRTTACERCSEAAYPTRGVEVVGAVVSVSVYNAPSEQRDLTHHPHTSSAARLDSARAGGGALPVIMSIIRSSRNRRLPQLQPLSAWYSHNPPPHKKTDSDEGVHSRDAVVQQFLILIIRGCFEHQPR